MYVETIPHITTKKLDEFSFDSRRSPCLYFSGVRKIKLNATTISKLRTYILKGGMIVFDSIYGSPYFYETAKSISQQIFPENAIRMLPADHPLFHLVEQVDEIHYPEEPNKKQPHIEAMYTGSMASILISKYGMGTGWNGDQSIFKKLKEKGLNPLYMGKESAQKIAINLYAYIVGYGEAGQIEGTPEFFGRADEKDPSDEFVFAQIRHGGSWNVHPTSTLCFQLLENLLCTLSFMRPVNLCEIMVFLSL
ncbi:MAG: DUF4159 domain-containing protein [Planctomycetes bacterium]|nr:DUF4159 domain-containing protein [Planctomycetota bacterium]